MSLSTRLLEKLNDAHYKKFKCPECNEYHLHIEGFTYGECEEGFMLSDKKMIEKILEDDDFDGYFSDEELYENFT